MKCKWCDREATSKTYRTIDGMTGSSLEGPKCLSETTEKLLGIKTTLVLNVVTCGDCGEPFAHKLGVTELHCPYCKFQDDISSFPDMWYEDEDSIVIINR